jgi:glycosyltransferase involved in cell wall biosynthesis
VGPYQNVLGEEAYAAHLAPLLKQLDRHWSFLGVVSPVELTAFFQECEVTVLPSINSTESYGIVQVESMTSGTPVIATDLPGVRVPIQKTGMGLLIPPSNAAALAEALLIILENPSRFRGYPEALVPLSTPQAVAEEYEELFRNILNK